MERKEESFAIEQLRRSNLYNPENLNNNDDFADFLKQNPVYHLKDNLLNPKAINFYTFNFDTLTSETVYIIKYSCKDFTSENHGVENYSESSNEEEGWESGKFIIDRKSFAFIKIEKNTFRNNHYNYPKFNNFIMPERAFTGEFVDGKLVVEYELINSKWYLKKLFHSYTNEYFRTQTYQKAYTISEYFELYEDTPTRYIRENLIDQFYLKPNLYATPYRYDQTQWKNDIPFYFFDKESIYKDLGNTLPTEEQFMNNGN